MSARSVRTVLVAAAVLVLGAGLARAQTPFAATNIGQRIRPDDARVIARGGWGMAVADTSHPGFKNQASLTYLRHVALRYTGYGERTTSTTASGERSGGSPRPYWRSAAPTAPTVTTQPTASTAKPSVHEGHRRRRPPW